MNGLAELLTSFDMSILYKVTYGIAEVVAKYLSSVLLLIAIYIRVMETQLDGFAGGGKYGVALRDMMLWTFVLGSYYGIGSLVFSFFNEVYAWLDQFGSLKTTMQAYATIMSKNTADVQAAGLSFTGLISSPYVAIAALFYYGTLIVLSFLAAFLKIASIMAFGLAFIWGLIAIPISITKTFNVLKGWGYLMGLALVWPIVQGLMIAMFGMLFTNSAQTLMTITDADPVLRSGNIMMLFAVMNLLLCAVLISAPLIANALVTNSPAGYAIVAPFAAAAVAAGVSTIKGRDAMGQGMGSSMPSSRSNTPAGGTGGPTARASAAKASFSGPQSAPSAKASPAAASSSLSASVDPNDAPPAPNSGAQAKKQQARRGAMVTQFKKRNRGA
jgi:hypothetical protein